MRKLHAHHALHKNGVAARPNEQVTRLRTLPYSKPAAPIVIDRLPGSSSHQQPLNTATPIIVSIFKAQRNCSRVIMDRELFDAAKDGTVSEVLRTLRCSVPTKTPK